MTRQSDVDPCCADPSRRTTPKLLASAAGLAAMNPPLVRARGQGDAAAAPHPTGRLYHGAAYYPELWPAEAVTSDIAHMKKLASTSCGWESSPGPRWSRTRAASRSTSSCVFALTRAIIPPIDGLRDLAPQ